MHMILMGHGKLIYFLARQLTSQGHTLTLICRDAEEAKTLSRQFKAVVLWGDGSDPHLLQEAEAYRAKSFLALTDQDEDNLVACQVAKQQFDVHHTLALVGDPDNQSLFQTLGVSIAVSATEIIANLIQQQTRFDDIQSMTPIAEGQLNVMEVTLDEKSPVVDKTLADLPLTHPAQLIGVMRQTTMLSLEPTTRLNLGDRIILVSSVEDCGTCLRALTGEEQ